MRVVASLGFHIFECLSGSVLMWSGEWEMRWWCPPLRLLPLPLSSLSSFSAPYTGGNWSAWSLCFKVEIYLWQNVSQSSCTFFSSIKWNLRIWIAISISSLVSSSFESVGDQSSFCCWKYIRTSESIDSKLGTSMDWVASSHFFNSITRSGYKGCLIMACLSDSLIVILLLNCGDSMSSTFRLLTEWREVGGGWGWGRSFSFEELSNVAGSPALFALVALNWNWDRRWSMIFFKN